MRHIAIAALLTVITAVPGLAQAPPPEPPLPASHLYGLDPYNPSDAAFLRNYGAALVAQTPLLELAELDPFNPSEAALLRQIGGALPIWSGVWYPGGPLLMPQGAFLPPGSSGEPRRWDAARAWVGMGTETQNLAPLMQNPPLPPARFDATRVDAFKALRPNQARPRVCRALVGDREIVC